MISHCWKRSLVDGSLISDGGGERSTIMILLEGERDESNSAVARPMPEEPPVMRTVLFRRFVRRDGETFTMLELDMMRLFLCTRNVDPQE